MREHLTQLEAELVQLRSLRDEGNIDRRLYERMLYEIETAKTDGKLKFLRGNTHKFVAITKNI